MIVQVIWDPETDPIGNQRHIEEGGVTQREVEEVLADPRSWRSIARSRSSGYPILFGKTGAGRKLAVVFDLVDDDPKVVYPITAYEPSKP